MKNFILLIAFGFMSISLWSQSVYENYDQYGRQNGMNGSVKALHFPNMNKDAGNEWYSAGPYGGDVLDFAFAPGNPDKVFAAAGNPYFRNSPDDDWHLLENLLNLSPGGIQSIEASANGNIYAAGASTFFKIFKSEDDGDTWTNVNVPISGSCLDICIDPNDPNTIYVTSTSNLSSSENDVIARSTDGGLNWTAFNMTAVLPVGWGCVNIEVDPENSQNILAIGNESFSNAAVIASFDGGANWLNISSNLPTGKPYNSLTINSGIIYVCGGQLFGGNVMGIYKSENMGSSWENISSAFPNKVVSTLLINPDNPLRMYAATEGDGVYYTLNGGLTWNYDTNGDGDQGSVRALAFYPGDYTSIYAGYLSLGVITSSDAGANWESSTIGIANLSLNDIETDGGLNGVIFSGFEAENSGGCYLMQNGQWSLVESLPATRFSTVDIDINGTLYAWSNGPTSIAPEGLYKSTDNGISWENLGPDIGSVFETEIWSVAVSRIDPNIIFIAGNNFGANGWASMIYKSINGGTDWVNVYMGADFDSFKYIYIEPNSNDQIIYAAYKSQDFKGGFLKSSDGGDTFTPINSGIPSEAKWAGTIISDPANADILYGGVGGQGGINASLYRSDDAGANWEATSLTLSNYSKFTDLLINPENSNVMYAATTLDGIYMTSDGQNWQAANNGIAATNITGFSRVFEYETDSLGFLASSFTNSAYHSALYNPTGVGVNKNVEKSLLQIFPNPCSNEFRIETNEQFDGISALTIYNDLGKLVYSETLKFTTTQSIKVNQPNGIYFLQLENSKGHRITKKLIIQ